MAIQRHLIKRGALGDTRWQSQYRTAMQATPARSQMPMVAQQATQQVQWEQTWPESTLNEISAEISRLTEWLAMLTLSSEQDQQAARKQARTIASKQAAREWLMTFPGPASLIAFAKDRQTRGQPGAGLVPEPGTPVIPWSWSGHLEDEVLLTMAFYLWRHGYDVR